MKLRNRFMGIILGTFLVPILVTILTMLLVAPEFVTLGKSAHKGVRDFIAQLEDGAHLEDITTYARGVPDSFFVLILDDDNRTIFRQDNRYDEKLFLESTTAQTILSKRILLSDGNMYTLVLGSGAALQYRSYVDFIVLISILLFLSFISFLTIRSINKSITLLEEGTRRIAEGDLDTPVILYDDDTFHSLAQSINTMRKKVKEEYDRRTRFFTGVSHDLKTPLASITGYSQALLDGLADNPQMRDKYLRIINTKGHILDRRIAQLIQYIKLTNHDFQSNLKYQMIVPFLEDFCELQKDEASLAGFTFESEISIDPLTVISYDQDLLSRALENLMQNSFRYGDTTKPVRLICHYKEDTIRLAFINHHENPIPSAVIKHIFEPFYRADQARKGPGFGLGLASVKSIAESHGWSVLVESLESEGITIFQIVIPREQEQQPSLPGGGEGRIYQERGEKG